MTQPDMGDRMEQGQREAESIGFVFEFEMKGVGEVINPPDAEEEA